MRRLPVYLIIDTSFSMRGEPLEAVKNGIRSLLTTLRRDPYALETVFISLITFNSEATQIVPLTELYLFQFVDFEAKGRSALGAALKLVKSKIENDFVKTTSEQKGDWKPLIFLMTDGGSTDAWKTAAKELRSLSLGMLLACGVGQKANIPVLKRISDYVVQIDSIDSHSINEFFKWVSSSIATNSKKIESFSKELSDYKELPPLPDEIKLLI